MGRTRKPKAVKTRRKLTPKEIVLKKYPGAYCHHCCEFGNYIIMLDYEDDSQENLSMFQPSAAKAWANSAAALPRLAARRTTSG